jgi:hypothetical protein
MTDRVTRRIDAVAPLRAGSVCSGYDGLDLAATVVLDTRPVWVRRHCPAPGSLNTIHRRPVVNSRLFPTVLAAPAECQEENR